MASVTLRRLTKTFDAVAKPALHELSLDVRDWEFLVLLGPSGCGKTTALRCIAGLEVPTAGEILIGEREVTHLPPADRDVAMVFQNYALYPHLTARANIAFGLEVRGVSAGDRASRAGDRRAARPGGAARPYARSALGRAAAARGAGAGDRARAPGVPVRRAALQPRRNPAHRAARRAAGAAPHAGRDDSVRHAGPGRGDDDGAADRGAA